MSDRQITRRDLLRGAAAVSASAVLPSAVAAAKDSPAVVLTLLHTNDLHGHVHHTDAPQGLARLATEIGRVRDSAPNVVLLDAGDIIHGTPEVRAFQGHPILDAMNALGYDAVTAGNHEFDFGQDVTRAAFAYARFPFLSANVVPADGPDDAAPWGGLKPYVMLERGGARVGVFGLTTPTTVEIEWPRTLAGIRFAEPYAAARRTVKHLRAAERADVVVALSHLGYPPDVQLAREVEGIDVILGGHTHTTLAEQVWESGTLILQTGAYGKALGRVDLLVRPGSGRVEAINGKDGRWWGRNGVAAPEGRAYPSAPLTPAETVAADAPKVVTVYAPYAERLRPHLDEELATLAAPFPSADAAKHETPVGNLLADAVRAQAKADIALFSSGQIGKGGLAAGRVRARDLYDLLGSYTRQHVVTVRATGAAVRSALKTARPVSGEQPKCPAHLSGAAVDAAGNVTVAGAPLDDARAYTVAAAAHVIQDWLYQKPGVTVLNDDVSAPTVRDAAIAYLRGRKAEPVTAAEFAPVRWAPGAAPLPARSE
jgi:2',3'-cyclic-nucleotide 2'-phosphodiesterase (5'-nucleotidase family)